MAHVYTKTYPRVRHWMGIPGDVKPCSSLRCRRAHHPRATPVIHVIALTLTDVIVLTLTAIFSNSVSQTQHFIYISVVLLFTFIHADRKQKLVELGEYRIRSKISNNTDILYVSIISITCLVGDEQ